MIINEEHRNFKRLYWNKDKEQIREILSIVNEKYLRGMYRKIQRNPHGKNGTRIYCRYSGYQFQVSGKTILDELKRRENN
jgi:hypothetical protein